MNERLLAPSELETWISYRRMRNRLADRIARATGNETGLSEADSDILIGLLAGEGEPVRAIALRCGLEWEKSRLSHQLRRMEQRGLVRRDPCLEDNRGAVIVLTAKGRELAIRARRAHDDAVRRFLFDVLSPEQIEALDDIAETVLATLEPQHAPSQGEARDQVPASCRKRRTRSRLPQPPGEQ